MLFSIDCESLPFFSFLSSFFWEKGGRGCHDSNNKMPRKKKNESCKPNFHDTNLSSAI